MSATVHWIWNASWQATCLAGLVFLTQLLLSSRLSRRGRSLLWFVVIARLLMPPLPTVRWTVFHLAATRVPVVQRIDRLAPVVVAVPEPAISRERLPPSQTSAVDPERVAELRAELAAMRDPPIVPTHIAALPPASPEFGVMKNRDYAALLPIIWITGASLAFARLLFATLSLSQKLRCLCPLADPAVENLFASCKREMGITRPITLLAADTLPGPALAGFVRPKVLLPTSVLSRFEQDELRLILLHELAHVRRGDVAVNWLLALLGVFHWFNPILWLAFRRVRADRELACDETVLSVTGNQSEIAQQYGHALLRLADGFATAHSLSTGVAGVVGMLKDSHELQRRIIMISRFNAAQRRWPALCAGVTLLIAGVAFTDAVEPATRPMRIAPALTSRPATSPSVRGTVASTQSVAKVSAVPTTVSTARLMTMRQLLEERLAARKAAYSAAQDRIKFKRQQFDAGVGGVSEAEIFDVTAKSAQAQAKVIQAENDLANAPDVTLNTALDSGVEGSPPSAGARTVAVLKGRIETLDRASKLWQQRHEAGVAGFGEVVEARNAAAEARAELVETEIPLFHPAGGSTRPGEAITPSTNTANRVMTRKELLVGMLMARKEALDTKRKLAAHLRRFLDAGLKTATGAMVAEADWAVHKAELKLSEAMIVCAREGVGDYEGLPPPQPLSQDALARVTELDRALEQYKNYFNVGLADFNAVSNAVDAAADARVEMYETAAALGRASESGQPVSQSYTRGEMRGGPEHHDLRLREKVAEIEWSLKREEVHRLEKEGTPAELKLAETQAAEAQKAMTDAQAKANVGWTPVAASQGEAHEQPVGSDKLEGGITATLQDPEAQRLDEETARKLATPVKIDFGKVYSQSAQSSTVGPRPIADWTHELGKAVGVEIRVETSALRAAGWRDGDGLGFAMESPMAASHLLDLALPALKGKDGTLHIGYAIDRGVVVISTVADLARYAVTRLYDVGDLAVKSGDENLPALIKAVVDPGSWRDDGCNVGVIRQFRDRLLVTQSQQNHVAIAKLLALMRTQAAAGKISGEKPSKTKAQMDAEAWTHLEEMLTAVKLYDQQHGHMPIRGFEDGRLQDLMSVPANINPRMPDLRYGYLWVAPDVRRLSDIKDPIHTPMICEVSPQSGGRMFVGFADGHVQELEPEQLKALKLDAAFGPANAEEPLRSPAVGTAQSKSGDAHERSATAIQRMLTGARAFQREQGRLPSGLDEVRQMLNEEIPVNPRFDYLARGYRWSVPAQNRWETLQSLADPAHTPLIEEALPQADGTELVGYADGHVADVKVTDAETQIAQALKARRDAVAEVRVAPDATVWVPKTLARECQEIADKLDKKRIKDDAGQVINEPGVRSEIDQAIASKIDKWMNGADRR